ncbi:hypothetical protein A9K55_005862 [Cordyceps militaris]|uniref:Uncharacterized protein n=1 Tax=Cordyceps militaris TaxID=73501 RepID=A0A2H4SBN6_CORMI|nr:hypothetical protein A9K55_005862 [Cordyceps militaris]
MDQEFLDHELMDDKNPSSCPLKALELPRLRRCAFDVSTLKFTGPINPVRTLLQERLDGGLDGYNWKIAFGDGGPFVLKVFWDQEPPTPPFYYALQRECQVAAVLQLMQAALTQDDPSLGPILVYRHPFDWVEGHENMLAFSDEWRRKGQPDCASTPLITITSMPRIRKCYGWIKITGDTLYQLPSLWRPPRLKIEKTSRQMERHMEYTALVYEYVEEGENDAAVIEESLNFFRDAGFSHTRISLARNWKKSVLIDMSDIIFSGGFGWKRCAYLSVNFIPGLDILSIKMPTLLEVLAEKSVAKDFNSTDSITGPNTDCKTDISVDDWRPWEDFTYDNIKHILKKELSRRYKGESEPQPLPLDLRVLKEDATQDALGRFPIPIVNYALNSSGGTEHFGRGSRCHADGIYVPDWSVVSQSHAGVIGEMLNMLPGDTKISSKWWSSMLEDDDRNFGEWKKVLDQIVTYMASCSARYGFIVTDTEVVALRIFRQYVSAGLAVYRPRRKRWSDATVRLSSDPVSTASSEEFQDNIALLWDFGVEYKAIPWSVYGPGILTGKLAQWALARMASYGDRDIEYSYPDLDTWRTQDTGYGIVHNTSGAKLEKPTKHTEIQQRDHFLHAAGGAGNDKEDLSSADRDASRSEVYESEALEEPELPQFSRAASAGLEYTAALPDAQAAEDQNAWMPVKVEKRGREYCYRDYKGNRKSSAKSDWEAVDGGYVFRGKRHVYFTKKLP